MGKRKTGFRKGMHKVRKQPQNPEERKPYNDIIKENEKFVTYYKTQKVCEDEQFDKFIICMKTDLPATFRITGSKGEAKKMLEIIEGQFIKNCVETDPEITLLSSHVSPNYSSAFSDCSPPVCLPTREEYFFTYSNFPDYSSTSPSYSPMSPPFLGDSNQYSATTASSKDLPASQKSLEIFPLPWYPQKLAWQMELTRKDIRRCEAYYKLHNFLISETEHGTISRQETVSMIPPLVLDVQPHHKILDMCAAPGSKTAQLLELLHAKDDPIPQGYVIANDVDNKRCYMLVHQAKRLNSPCVAVINHDSAVLPNLLESLPDGSTQQVLFDRILCDVPCSGDGTLRKNPDIWLKWTPANALNLHGIQYRILKRGVELLKPGGRIVYSTCSINPIENESVIHRLLAEANGSVQLVDPNNMLPGLKYSPGMEKWLVGSRNLEFYESFDDVDEKWRTTIRPQMFPPKEEDLPKYNLNRCIRILPHMQNTGAFFVAILEKVASLDIQEGTPKSEQETERKSQDDAKKRINNDNLPQSQRKRHRKDGYREDPFVFFKDDEKVWDDIKSFYQIDPSFDSTCLLTRCQVGKKKNIYLTSNGVRDLVLLNQGSIKFINTGVKAFVRCDNKNMKCAFRIANDGLESIYPFIGEDRKINIPREDLITLLMNNDPMNSPLIKTLSEIIQQQVADLSPGSCVLVYTENKDAEEPFVLHLSGWRGTTSLRCYTTKHSTVHLLRLLGGDISKYDVNKFKKQEQSEGKEDSKEQEEKELDVEEVVKDENNIE